MTKINKYKPMFLDEKRILSRLVSATLPKPLPAKKGRKATTASSSKTFYAFDFVEIKRRADALNPTQPGKGMAPVVKVKGSGYKYKENQMNKYAYNPPYGVIPQLENLNPDQLRALADEFSIMKFQYQERGDYLRAWLFGWRQRLIERVLSRTATIDYGL